MDTTLFKELINFGAVGIFSVLLVLFARGLLAREQARSDAQSAEVTRLNNLMVEKIMPALISATQAISSSQALLQAIQIKEQISSERRKAQNDTT